MKRNKAKSLNVAAAGILQAVDAAGKLGAPGGALYAGLMAAGYTLAEFEQVMAALAGPAGLVLKRGQLYTLTDKGVVMNARITEALRKAA